MEQSKIDAVINRAIDGVQNRGRGFVLDLAARQREDLDDALRRVADARATLAEIEHGDTPADAAALAAANDILSEAVIALDGAAFAMRGTSIEVRETLAPVDEYVKPAEGRKHQIGDTASFVAYARRYGTKDRSLVLYSDEGATLTIDEEVERGEREIVSLDFDLAEDWTDWTDLLGKPVVHKTLYKFLLSHGHNLDDIALLEAVRTMRANVQVKHESDLAEDAKTIGFLIKAEKGEELKKFPKTIAISLPVLEADVADPEAYQHATLTLEIDLPERPDQSVAFTLLCPKWNLIRRERIRREAELIQEGLEGFTVVRGVHRTFAREIGRKAAPASSR